MEKLKMHSPNLTQDNIARIRDLFPGCVTEAKSEDGSVKLAVDFDQLRQELAESIVEGPQERYHLNWPGKREALLTANAPIAKTLRPCREESVNFDSTKNLFIEGDNLDALKLLQETYLGKVKMIYIDPPYNTGNDFIYADDFSVDKSAFELTSGVRDDQGNKLFDEERWKQNSSADGRFHSTWLSMIYSRLRLARNLLRDDGAIAIHIDENEYTNLEKVLSEVFGESNNLGTIVWDKRNPKGEVAGVAQQHELISLYCKNKEAFASASYFSRKKENADAMLRKVDNLIKSSGGVNDEVRELYRKWLKERKSDLSGGELAYSLIDDNGDIYRPVSMAAPDKPETRSHRPLIHPDTNKPCPVPAKGWRFPDKSMDELLRRNEILFGPDENTQPQRKYLLRENIRENVPSLLYFGGSDDALGLPFDNPKPVAVAAKIIESICRPGEVVMDFFAGSATTAHAVMQLNAEDGGNRSFILVQLPEPCPDNSSAKKAGFSNIASISMERIRRAGKNTLERQGHDGWNKDVGFRALKIDTTNMADVYYAPDALDKAKFELFVDSIKPDRTPEDLLFQVMLDWGVDLALPITKQSIQGKDVFFVDGNVLAACFDASGSIDEAFVKELAKQQPLRVVFRDAGYKNSAVKINVEQIFKLLSPATEVKCI